LQEEETEKGYFAREWNRGKSKLKREKGERKLALPGGK